MFYYVPWVFFSMANFIVLGREFRFGGGANGDPKTGSKFDFKMHRLMHRFVLY